ncbi:hypothetical protein ACFPRL_24605 [Pseudoclavibacter helvolus]
MRRQTPTSTSRRSRHEPGIGHGRGLWDRADRCAEDGVGDRGRRGVQAGARGGSAAVCARPSPAVRRREGRRRNVVRCVRGRDHLGDRTERRW